MQNANLASCLFQTAVLQFRTHRLRCIDAHFIRQWGLFMPKFYCFYSKASVILISFRERKILCKDLIEKIFIAIKQLIRNLITQFAAETVSTFPILIASIPALLNQASLSLYIAVKEFGGF